MSTLTDQAWLRPVHSIAGTMVRKVGAPVRMPWKLALFLLVIFAVAQPFDSLHSLPEAGLDLSDTVTRIEQGSTARPIAMVALGIFAIVTLARNRSVRIRPVGLLGWAALAYVALAVASPLWAQDPVLTFRRSLLLVFMALGALAVAVRLSRAQVVALTVCVCSMTLAISVVVQIAVGGFTPLSDDWRFAGVLHPVVQGWNCGLLLLASLTMSVLNPRNRTYFLLLSGVAMLFLVLTKSRMPLVSTIIGSAALAIGISSESIRRRLLIPGSAMLISLTLLGIFLPQSSVSNIAALGRGEEARSSLTTFTGRLDVWDEALTYSSERPLLGYGYNSFLDARHLPSMLAANGWVFLSLHSGYIETLLGLGYLGVVLLMTGIVLALRQALQLSRNSPFFAFGAGIIAWLMCSLATESTVITEPAFPMLLWLIVCTDFALTTPFPQISRHRQ